MEIIKTPIKDKIIKIEIGAEYNEKNNTLTGAVELDIENQSFFIENINSVFDEDNINIIVDMKNISYIDSSGLWALFEGHKKAEQKNGIMVLLSPSKDVKRVLDITKMSSKIQLFNDETKAISALSEK
jgi:anti-sigma B factor antagonist